MPKEGQPASYDDGVKRGRLLVYGHDGTMKHEQDMDENTLVQNIGKESAKRLLAATPTSKQTSTYSRTFNPDELGDIPSTWRMNNQEPTRVQFEKNEDGGGILTTWGKHPDDQTKEVMINSGNVKRLRPENAGPMYEKLFATTPTMKPSGPARHALEGKDIIVGGQGYADVYDREMVNFANKYTKKWGGKVEDADVSSEIKSGETPGTIHVLKITPAMREALKKDPQMLFSRRHQINLRKGGLFLKGRKERKDLDQFVRVLGTFVQDAREHNDDDDTLEDTPKKAKRSRSGKTVILPDGTGFFVATVGKSAALPNRIPGGKADKAKKKLTDFDPKKVAEGAKIEREHTSSQGIAEEISRDHLTEDPQYYKKLKRMEAKKSLAAFETLRQAAQRELDALSG